MLPLVSIILPTYNGFSKGMLRRAIDSCLNQTYTNIELIVVDDGSTDATYKVLKDIADCDDRVRIIKNDNNQKLPKSLNIGFTAAKGEFLTWTSDDNFYTKEAIETMLQALLIDDTVGIIYANEIIVDDMMKELRRYEKPTADNLVFYNCIRACFLYRKEVQELVGGYDEKMFLVEDYDFWLRAYKLFKLKPLNVFLYYYTEHNASLSATKRRSVCVAEIRVVKKNILRDKVFSRQNRIRRCWIAIKGSVKYGRLWLMVELLLDYIKISWENYD